jgi:hypothetical protein
MTFPLCAIDALLAIRLHYDYTAIRTECNARHTRPGETMPETTVDLAKGLPDSDREVYYPDAGHGGIFQFDGELVRQRLELLAR